MGHAAKQGSELCCSICGAAAVVVTGGLAELRSVENGSNYL